MNAALHQRLFAQRRRVEAALARSVGKEDHLVRSVQPAGEEVIQPSGELYHGTNRFNLPSITNIGLVPQIGSNTKDAQSIDKEAEVHLTTDPKVARKYGDTVVKIDPNHPGVKGFKKDPHEKKSVTTNVRIPPDAISVVESGFWHREIKGWMSPDGDVHYFPPDQEHWANHHPSSGITGRGHSSIKSAQNLGFVRFGYGENSTHELAYLHYDKSHPRARKAALNVLKTLKPSARATVLINDVPGMSPVSKDLETSPSGAVKFLTSESVVESMDHEYVLWAADRHDDIIGTTEHGNHRAWAESEPHLAHDLDSDYRGRAHIDHKAKTVNLEAYGFDYKNDSYGREIMQNAAKYCHAEHGTYGYKITHGYKRLPFESVRDRVNRILESRADALLKHRKDVSQRKFTITADKDTLNSLDKFFALLHHNPGHSATFGMDFDGDGHQVFVVDPPPSKGYAGRDKKGYVCVAESSRSSSDYSWSWSPSHGAYIVGGFHQHHVIHQESPDHDPRYSEGTREGWAKFNTNTKELQVHDYGTHEHGMDPPSDIVRELSSRHRPKSTRIVRSKYGNVNPTIPIGKNAKWLGITYEAPPRAYESRRSTITHHSLITQHGYDQVMMTDSHRFGNVAQYLHPASGDQITLSKRFQKGRQQVRHTNDPTDWTDRWTHVNGRTGETVSGHTLHSLYQQLAGGR